MRSTVQVIVQYSVHIRQHSATRGEYTKGIEPPYDYVRGYFRRGNEEGCLKPNTSEFRTLFQLLSISFKAHIKVDVSGPAPYYLPLSIVGLKLITPYRLMYVLLFMYT